MVCRGLPKLVTLVKELLGNDIGDGADRDFGLAVVVAEEVGVFVTFLICSHKDSSRLVCLLHALEHFVALKSSWSAVLMVALFPMTSESGGIVAQRSRRPRN